MRKFLNSTALIGLVLAASSAFAEPDAPHETLAIPEATTPAPVEQTPAAAPLSSAATPPATIHVDTVSPPSLDGFGTLDEKNGGLPATIWKESTLENAAPLLNWIHGGVAQTELRDLTIHLLLSQATPPAGSPKDWFLQRIEALIALGADDKAEELMAAVPASLATDALEQTRTELLLLRGDVPTVCKNAQERQASSTTGEAFWARINILCKASEGKKDEALLALDVLRESSAQEQEDMFFQEAIHKMTDRTYAVRNFPAHWSLLDVGLLRLLGDVEKAKDKLDVMPPLALKYIAADTTLDPKLREKAASKAEALGIIASKDSTKPQIQPFAAPLASDVTTLVTALGSGSPPTDADSAVIARLTLDDTAALQDCRRVQRLLSLMEPFGYHVTPDVWNKLFQRRNRYDGDIPPAALVDRLNAASQAGRKAEVILLSALILGNNDVDKTHEIVLLPVIRALQTAGFSKEARSIAYDAVQSYRTH